MIAQLHAASNLLMTDAAATIVAALIGAAAGIGAGIGGAWIAFVLPERKKRPTLIADLLEVIAESVTQMIAMFEKEEIPHQAGHELYTTTAYFEKGTHRRFVDAMALETLDSLKGLAQEAEIVDLFLYQGKNGETLRKTWVTKAKGIVGELRGEAAKLRAKL